MPTPYFVPHWPKSGGSKKISARFARRICPPLSKSWRRPCPKPRFKGSRWGRKGEREGREREKGKKDIEKGKEWVGEMEGKEGEWESPTYYFRFKSCTALQKGTTYRNSLLALLYQCRWFYGFKQPSIELLDHILACIFFKRVKEPRRQLPPLASM